jgi:Xaa-Pro aminopeptidase
MENISPTEFAARRKRLMEKMEPGSALILAAAPEFIRNQDAHYPYRQNSHFYYLTGFSEPQAVLVLIPGRSQGEYILFNRPRDPQQERWQGKRAGQEGARVTFLANEAHTIESFDRLLPELLDKCRAIYCLPGADLNFDKRVLTAVETLQHKTRKGTLAPEKFINIESLLGEMRLLKSPAEIALMRKAAEISAEAHCRAMRACRADMYEYELEAELLYEFTRKGSRSPAYTSIVGSGAHACTLHYTDNTALLQSGDLVLIDAACEYQLYAADITRTFPVNGRFTTEQRAIYEIVLAAQLAGIAEIRPGVAWSRIQEVILQVITKGLVTLGILKGSVEQLIADKAYLPFYMHNSGHWLGMDVHDVGHYQIDGEWRPLQAGMVLTVEPGIYISAQTKGVDEKWWNIGIRIEDDVLVTAKGSEVLSVDAPKTIPEIEALMSSTAS